MLKPLCFRRQIISNDFKKGSSLPNVTICMLSGFNKCGRFDVHVTVHRRCSVR
jgi:hypothetical protein